jgi:hypothetical protein
MHGCEPRDKSLPSMAASMKYAPYVSTWPSYATHAGVWLPAPGA